MTLTSLRKILIPPAKPIEAGSTEKWPKIEKSLGTSLPSDYKKYINTFGTGQIGAFLFPFNPFSKNKNLNLLKQVPIRLDALRTLKEQGGEEECPYPLFPESGGLLPWGATDNGDVLFWLMTKRPNNWPVVINESRGPMFEQYDETMTTFLAKLIANDIHSKIIPNNFLDKKALFVSIK